MEPIQDGYLVGRTHEIDRIVEGASRSPVVLIYGIAGIGKTELAYRASLLLRGREWNDAKLTLVRVVPGFATRLGTLVAMRLRGPTIADTCDADDGNEWLIDELEARRHLLILDDAHLAAGHLVSLVDAIMRRRTKSLLLVTSRSELDLTTAPVIVRLGPLPDLEARALVLLLAERLQLGTIDEDEIVRRGGGSPFLLRALVGSWYADRERTADPLRDSIDALAAEDRAALVRIVAIAPCPVGSPAIEGLADPAAVTRLRRRFLIGEEHGRLVVHDLVRDATLTACTVDEVAAARRAAAEAARATFASSGYPAHAIEAICLLTSAGDYQAAEAILAATYPQIAAASLDHLLLPSLATLAETGAKDPFLLRVRVMLRMGRIDEAHDLLAAKVGDRELASRWQYHAFRGIAAQRRGQLADARTHFASARDTAPAGRMRARMVIHLADVLSLAGDCAPARALLADVETSPDLKDADRARIRWSEALGYALEQNFSAVLERIAIGRDLAVRANARDVLGLFGMLHTIAATETGDLVAARQTLAGLIGTSSGPRLRAEVEELCRGMVTLAAGEISDAVATLRRTYDFYRKHRDEVLACLTGHFLGRALLASGDAPAAHSLLIETASRAETAGLTTLVATGRLFAARAAISLGRVTEATAAVRALRAHSWPWIRAAATSIEAYGAAMAGDLNAARSLIRLALDEAGEREPLRSDLLVDAADIEAMGGDPEVVITAARAALDREASFGRRYQEGRALAALIAGLLARRAPEDLCTAGRHLDELVALCASAGIGHLATRAGLLRAIMEAPAGSAGGASIVSSATMGPETMPGTTGYLRFVGAIRPRLWIAHRDRGRFGGDADVAALRAECDLFVDTIANVLSSRHATADVRNRPAVVDLVAWLAQRRGVAASAEDLYCGVWGASEYHPLRNRNTLYIALNRARRALADLLPGREIIARGRDGWLIPTDLDVCVIKLEPTRSGARQSSGDEHEGEVSRR